MKIINRTFALSMWVEYYRWKAESTIAKLVDKYQMLNVASRMKLMKSGVDNIECMKAVIDELMKQKYKPFMREEYNGIMLALTKLQWYLLKQDYASASIKTVKNTVKDLSYVVYALESMRRDLADIAIGKSKPMWFSPVTSDKVKKVERRVSEKYYAIFNSPLAVFISL